MKIKYVIIDGISPVIFSSGIPHKDLQKLGTITAAGFLKFYSMDSRDIDIAVYGKSESLEMHSQPEDAEVIKRILG